MRNKVNFRCLTISTGDGKRIQDQESGEYRRQYVVTVQSDATGATRRFTYMDSINNERNGRVGLAGTDLLEAFRCFVSDADAGSQSFADFAADFGYDPDSYAALQTHKALLAAARKLRDLFAGPVDTADVLEDLARLRRCLASIARKRGSGHRGSCVAPESRGTTSMAP